MNQLRTLDDLELAGRVVLCRVDFNVPLDGERVTDDTRIRLALPTIERLRAEGAKVVLCSHFGRPAGKPDPAASLLPAAATLANLLDTEVVFAHDTIGAEVARLIEDAEAGSIVVLENLRYFAGEENNKAEFSKALADLAEIYVNDAFGTMHRAHASIVGIPEHIPAAAGLLVQREIEVLGRMFASPARPFGAVLGGAKVSDKIEVIDRLSQKADHLFLGGAMAYTFMAAKGEPTGISRVELDQLDFAREMLAAATARSCTIHLPTDHVVAASFSEEAPVETVETIPEYQMGLDIGPATRARWAGIIDGCRTLFWNGPMGVFEWEATSHGSRAIAKAFAKASGFTVVGGGDSAAAVAAFGLSDEMDHISTGGGASLQYIKTGDLVGLEPLRRRR